MLARQAQHCRHLLRRHLKAQAATVLDDVEPQGLQRPGDGPELSARSAQLDAGARQPPQGPQVALLDDPAVLDDRHRTAQALYLGQDVTGEQNRAALGSGSGNLLGEDPLHERIQTAGGLIEHQQTRRRGQGGHQRHLLPVPLGVGPYPFAGIQIEALNELGLPLGVARAAQPGQGVEHLATGQGRPQRHVTGNIGDLPVDERGLPPRLAAQHAHASTIGPVEPQQDADRGGFPRPIGAEETVDAARLHCQVQAVERPEAPEVLDQAAHAHRWLAAGAQVADGGRSGVRGGLIRTRAGHRC